MTPGSVPGMLAWLPGGHHPPTLGLRPHSRPRSLENYFPLHSQAPSPPAPCYPPIGLIFIPHLLSTRYCPRC